MNITERLRLALDRSALSQRALAEKTGISLGAINNYLSGKHKPGIEEVEKLARAFDMEAAELIGWKERGRTAVHELMEGDRPAPAESEIWRRRAQNAEAKLNHLRETMRAALQESDPSKSEPAQDESEDPSPEHVAQLETEMAAYVQRSRRGKRKQKSPP